MDKGKELETKLVFKEEVLMKLYENDETSICLSARMHKKATGMENRKKVEIQ
jgi:hypothetical protein|tara:strand:- start:1157 stop:1312 length:156 start_codon:yes stop_codon:yes gene_type:complete